jgi:hypothetical protein
MDLSIAELLGEKKPLEKHVKLALDYLRQFNLETLTGDIKRDSSNKVFDLYAAELVENILQGPTVQKLMADKNTSNPWEVIPELYALYLEERKHPKGKIGLYEDKLIQQYLVSERVEALYPLYVSEMTTRIENGPDFEKITMNQLLGMHRVCENVPDPYLDWIPICRPLFDSGVLVQEGFSKSEDGGTGYGLFSKNSFLKLTK